MPREFEWKCVPIIAQTLFQTLRIVPSLYANQQWHVTKVNVSGNMNQFQIPRCVAELVAAFELFKCRWGTKALLRILCKQRETPNMEILPIDTTRQYPKSCKEVR